MKIIISYLDCQYRYGTESLLPTCIDIQSQPTQTSQAIRDSRKKTSKELDSMSVHVSPLDQPSHRIPGNPSASIMQTCIRLKRMLRGGFAHDDVLPLGMAQDQKEKYESLLEPAKLRCMGQQSLVSHPIISNVTGHIWF